MDGIDLVDTEARSQLLTDVIGAFAEATTDYNALLDTISRKLAETVGDLCSVLLASDDLATLSLVSTYDPDPQVLALARDTFSAEPFAIVPVQRGVLETGDAFVSSRISPDRTRQLTTDKRAAFTEAIGMHSVLLVALRARGRPLGVLNLVRHRKDRSGYGDRDRDLAQLLADHAAVAIANARLLRQHHDELQRAKEAAEATSHELRLANESAQITIRELEAFSFTVAHDLRAPLRSIDGFASILDDDYSDRLDDDGRGCVQYVRAAAKRMAQLIDDLLKLARLSRTAIHRQRVDISDLSRSILDELRARGSASRHVRSRVADGLFADADPGLLRIVFENLLGNAWKFTAKREIAQITVDGGRRGNTMIYEVADNGAGFDPALVERLFVPFQRLHSEAEFEGTGIGLATVRRIVALHGGRVWAMSEPGSGARFKFTLDPAETDERSGET